MASCSPLNFVNPKNCSNASFGVTATLIMTNGTDENGWFLFERLKVSHGAVKSYHLFHEL